MAQQDVACVVNWDGVSAWQLLTTGNHNEIFVDTVVSTTNGFTVNFDATVANVTSFIVGVDETLAQHGIFAGASVSLTNAAVQLGRVPRRVSGRITWNPLTNNWDIDGAAGSLAFSSFDDGVLTLSHDACAGYEANINAAPLSKGIEPKIFELNSTTTKINFRSEAGLYDSVGNILGNRDGRMDFYFDRSRAAGGPQIGLTSEIGPLGGNFFCYGQLDTV